MPVKYKTTAKEEWDQRTLLAVAKKYEKPVFDPILKQLLPTSDKMSCIEIGAIPGGFLAYFNKEFKYSITGIDFANNKDIFASTMKLNNIKDYDFINADIKNYRINKKYNVVCSFGFIEHFDNYKEIIDKHIDLLAEDGYLVLSLPNFRNLQYLYRVLFDKENLKIHNLDSMKLKNLKKILDERNMTELYSGHLGGIEFWYDSAIKSKFKQSLRHKIAININKLKTKLPNSYLYSPMILLVYKRGHESKII